MELNIISYQTYEIVRVLSAAINSTVVEDCMEERCLIPEAYGVGSVVCFDFGGGIGLLIYHGTLKENITITISTDTPHLQFHFVVKGSVRHILDGNEERYSLSPLQGSITASASGEAEHFHLQANTEILFTKLCVNRALYTQKMDCLIDKMPKELSAIFSDVTAQNSFIYQNPYSIAIGETIKQIIDDKNEGLVRNAFVEGKTLELLAQQIKQFSDDLRLPEKQVVVREQDLAKIEAAKELLTKNLTTPPTIEELAKLVGINRQKLKSGFKKVVGTTINAYLRGERLSTASLLLLSGNTVVEAATAVGYTNQSHFARRFKEKYSVLPKDYLKMTRSKIQPL